MFENLKFSTFKKSIFYHKKDRVSPEPSAPLSPTFTTTSNLPPPPAYSEINPHPHDNPEVQPPVRPPSDSDDSDSGENEEPRESQTTNL